MGTVRNRFFTDSLTRHDTAFLKSFLFVVDAGVLFTSLHMLSIPDLHIWACRFPHTIAEVKVT